MHESLIHKAQYLIAQQPGASKIVSQASESWQNFYLYFNMFNLF